MLKAVDIPVQNNNVCRICEGADCHTILQNMAGNDFVETLLAGDR
jgi:hypothetical protein